jgi:outer membrane receptor protein involved in Fe transport
MKISMARVTNTALLTLLVMLSGTPIGDARAQTEAAAPAAEPPPDAPLAEIIVTGSRIPRPDIEGTAPVTLVSEQEFVISGAANVESLLNTLPQFTPSRTARSNNPGNGAAQIYRPGLGANRNLVLVNGRRYMFFDETQVTDINTIPSALVQRVEVVTGGASAVYGSDAIAGVTNFILRDDFEGVEFRGQIGGDTDGDAQTKSMSVTMGGNFADDRGNAVVSIDYYDREPILQGERSYSRVALGDGVVDGAPALVARGSTQGPNGSFGNIPFGAALNVPGREGLRDALAAAGLSSIGALGFTFDDAGTTARPFVDPQDRFNFAPDNYLQTPQERYALTALADYEISSNITGYLEGAFASNRVDSRLAAANIDFGFQYNTNNPFLSPEVQEVLRQLDLQEGPVVGGVVVPGPTAGDGLVNLRTLKRFAEVGPRVALTQRDSWRVGGGVRGDLGDFSEQYLRKMSFDAYYFTMRSNSVTNLNNNVSFSKLSAGLLRPSPGADPLVNVFGQNMSPEAVAALRINTANTVDTELQVAAATIGGEMFDLPAGAVAASLGTEWRKSAARNTPDHALSSGDVIGFSGFQPTDGEVKVWELFGEFLVPVLKDLSYADSLTLNGGFRYSDYDLDNVGGVWTYLGGADWAISRSVALRGQYQHAIRAPSIGELFGGQTASRPLATDPCAQASSATDATVRALCVQTGVPEAFVGNAAIQPNTRIDTVTGGNPDLQEETADTVTFGFVITPQAIPRLSVTVDYFDIEVEDAIAAFAGGANSILSLCYLTIQDANSSACQAVQRNPTTGIISLPYAIQAVNANIGELAVSGIDLQARYGFDVDWGLLSDVSTFDLSFAGTWTEKFDVTPLADRPGDVNECVGAFGNTCGEPRAEWKSTARVSMITGPLTLSLRHRFIDAVTDDRIVLPARSGNPGPSKKDFAAPELDSQHYLDLSFLYDFHGGKISINGGINNITDSDPPITGGSQQQANTWPSTYDALGPEFFLGIIARL